MVWDGSFNRVKLHGEAASITYGYHTAAVVRSWVIRKREDGCWTLTATIARADRFQCRQRGLLFSAPRDGGFWCWPIETLTLSETQLQARLGPPEQ